MANNARYAARCWKAQATDAEGGVTAAAVGDAAAYRALLFATLKRQHAPGGRLAQVGTPLSTYSLAPASRCLGGLVSSVAARQPNKSLQRTAATPLGNWRA